MFKFKVTVLLAICFLNLPLPHAWAEKVAESIDFSMIASLPLLHAQLAEFAAAKTMSAESQKVLKEYFHSSGTTIVPLTPELREKLKLDKFWYGVFYPGDVSGVKKAPVKAGEETLNDRIIDDEAGVLDKSKLNVLLQDVTGHGGGYREKEGWAIQSMGHEMAHARMHLLLGRVAPELLQILPPELFYKAADGYYMNGQLLDLLHEWYAYRVGYNMMVEYYASMNPVYAYNRIYRPMFTTPHGRRTFAFNHKQVDSVSKKIAIEIYGITNPDVLALADRGILDRILGLDEIPCAENLLALNERPMRSKDPNFE